MSSIERVKLSELEFPSVTVCPAFPTDSIATKTIYNRSGVNKTKNFRLHLFDELCARERAKKVLREQLKI